MTQLTEKYFQTTNMTKYDSRKQRKYVNPN